MPPAQAWRTLRYSSTLKILAPSLLSQKGKGWTTFTPPAAAPCRRFRGLVSHRRSHAFRFPDGIEHGTEFRVGITDQEARRNPLSLMTCCAGAFPVPDFCLIFAPFERLR